MIPGKRRSGRNCALGYVGDCPESEFMHLHEYSDKAKPAERRDSHGSSLPPRSHG